MVTRLKFVYPNGSMQEMVGRLLANMAVSVDNPISLPSAGSLLDLDLGTALITDIAKFRSQDIPVLLGCGAFDLGIVGRDWLVEREADVVEIAQFSLSRSSFVPIRLVLAAPKEFDYKSILDLPKGVTIATEYPVTVQKYLLQYGRDDIQIQLSYGQTEDKIAIGAADAVIDITETGRSLREKGLVIIETIAESVMTLSANKNAFNDPIKRSAMERIGEMLKDCYRLMLLNERRS